MEKIIWVRSNGKMLGAKEDDGLETINNYLENGWKVKHISACAVGDHLNMGRHMLLLRKMVINYYH